MGMFDYVVCDYKLPLTDSQLSQLEDKVDWENMEWQTKSFDCALDHYSIEDDGQLYRQIIEYVEVETENDSTGLEEGQVFGAPFKTVEKGIERVDWTGEVIFYNMIIDKEYDYWIEFKCLFWKGDLKEIDLLEFKKEDNHERKEIQQKMNSKVLAIQSRHNKWWHPIYNVWAKCVKFVLFIIRYLIGLVANLSWKIERWLT